MARRAKTSVAEDLLDLVAMLPWWAGVALAGVSWLVLRSLAAAPVVAGGAGGPPDTLITSVFVKVMANVGQVIVPLLCLGGAGLSAFRRAQRRRLIETAAQSPGASAIEGLSWQDFERLVGEAFRRQGYRVMETGGGGADGGVDLVLSRPAQNGSETTLVQCKQWRAFKVGVEVVRELYGVMAARGAAAGIVVTSGSYTEAAREFAQGRNVRLIDGAGLRGLIGEGCGAAQAGGARPATASAGAAGSAAGAVPACPVCAKPMVLRTAQRGARAGSRFWGCSGYPGCRGTRDGGGAD